MKKILFVSPLGLEGNARGVRTRNLAASLHKKYDVLIDLVCFDSPSLKNYSCIFNNITTITKSKFTSFVEGDKCFALQPIFFSKIVRKIFVKFFPDYYVTEASNFDALLNRVDFTQYSRIIFFSYPFFTLELEFLKKIYSRVYLDIGDPITCNPFLHANGNLIGRLIGNCKERNGIKKFSRIIVTNDKTKQYFLRKYSFFNSDQINVIPQGAAVKNYRYFSSSSLNNSPTMIFTYAGAFYPIFRDPGHFINVLSTKELDVRFNYFGSYKFKKNYSFIVNNGVVGTQALIEEYQASSVILYFENVNCLQSSGKIFELLALNKPIWVIGEIFDVSLRHQLSNYDFVYFSNNDFLSISLVFDAIVKDFASSKRYSFDVDLSSFSWDSRASKYADVLRITNEE